MALVDAYIQCKGIQGGYIPPPNTPASTDHSGSEFSHENWSEITSFKYTIKRKDEHPGFDIRKVLDCASNSLYLRLLQHDSRGAQKSMQEKESIIPEIVVHLCRWVKSSKTDGVQSQVFLQYAFTDCHVKSYSTGLSFEADNIPEEDITFSYKKMEMVYWPEGTEEATDFSWTQANAKASSRHGHGRRQKRE
jgi:type VI protein secretion system component Hcp